MNTTLDNDASPGQVIEPIRGMARIQTGQASIVIVESTPKFNPPIGTVL